MTRLAVHGYCLSLAMSCVGVATAMGSLAEPVPQITASVTEYVQLQIRGRKLNVEIADTTEARTQGLSGRKALCEDQGLLLVFPNDGRYSIWMKDMKFSLDILWINRFGKIVHLERNVHPDTYPKIFTSSEPARYVLEVLAGVGAQVEIGDAVRFSHRPAHTTLQ